jgi:hypothetical protein
MTTYEESNKKDKDSRRVFIKKSAAGTAMLMALDPLVIAARELAAVGKLGATAPWYKTVTRWWHGGGSTGNGQIQKEL